MQWKYTGKNTHKNLALGNIPCWYECNGGLVCDKCYVYTFEDSSGKKMGKFLKILKYFISEWH